MINRGSTWHRWDLHIHTPASILANQYDTTPTGWGMYVDKLEKEARENDVVGFGITDYYSIEGYKKLLDFQRQGRLANILLLPNIEMRLTIQTKAGKGINFHIIFSNEIDPSFLSEFLSRLKMEIDGTAFYCTQDGLARLGHYHDRTLSLEKALEKGVIEFKVDIKDVVTILEREFAHLHNKYLFGVPNSSRDGASGIPDDSFRAIRTELYRRACFIFSGTDNDRAFFLGQTPKDPQEVIEDLIGNLKPCFHGSDAHEIEKICNPDEQKYCWVKAEPNFNGLLQCMYEPEARVHIGKDRPSPLDPSKIIDCITIKNSGDWFSEEPIYFNSGLNCIIGAKGSGKTALLDMIALGTHCYESKTRGTSSTTSFIDKASQDLKKVEVEIKWLNGSLSKASLSSIEKENKQAVYLSQHGLENLCSYDKSDELLRVINNIVFEYIPKSDRMQTTDFDALKSLRASAIKQRRDSLITNLEQLHGLIFSQYLEIRALPEKKMKLAECENDLCSLILILEDEKKKTKDASDLDIQNEILAKEGECDRLNGELARYKQNITKIEELIAASKELDASIFRFNELFKKTLNDIQYEAIPIELEYKINCSIESFLNERKKTIIGCIAEDFSKINQIELEIGVLKTKFSTNLAFNKRIEEVNGRILKKSEEISLLKQEILRIEASKEKEFLQIRRNRCEIFADYLITLKDELTILGDLYRPLKVSLESSGRDQKHISIEARIKYDAGAHSIAIDALFNHQKKLPYPDADELKERLGVITSLMELFSLGKTDKTTIVDAIIELEDSFTKVDGVEKELEKILKATATKLSLDKTVFALDHYQTQYQLQYDYVPLDKLSPGIKGIILLIIFLHLDKAAQGPILLDQPEENLDNRSVFDLLKDHFREAKERRQIFLVTHNANLAVNTDAEEVLVANFDLQRKKQDSKIRYVSGGLEKTKEKDESISNILDMQGIREHVCDILEGGKIAFFMREQKYALPELLKRRHNFTVP